MWTVRRSEVNALFLRFLCSTGYTCILSLYIISGRIISILRELTFVFQISFLVKIAEFFETVALGVFGTARCSFVHTHSLPCFFFVISSSYERLCLQLYTVHYTQKYIVRMNTSSRVEWKSQICIYLPYFSINCRYLLSNHHTLHYNRSLWKHQLVYACLLTRLSVLNENKMNIIGEINTPIRIETLTTEYSFFSRWYSDANNRRDNAWSNTNKQQIRTSFSLCFWEIHAWWTLFQK